MRKKFRREKRDVGSKIGGVAQSLKRKDRTKNEAWVLKPCATIRAEKQHNLAFSGHLDESPTVLVSVHQRVAHWTPAIMPEALHHEPS
jgi:hypothetical protein